MKACKIIILSILSMIIASCSSVHYNIVTRINPNGTVWREIQTTTSKTDSLPELFPYNLSYGWEIVQTDTVVEEYLSPKNKKNVKIRKKFNSVNDLSADLRSDLIFPTAKESLKKRFRWFYTYYEFAAIYPKITDKGRVPLEEYLTKSEQYFYFQGAMSPFKGMNGMELKEVLDDIETRFLKWYNRSMYEESYDIILHFSAADFQPELSTVKDTVFSILEKQNIEHPNAKDICLALDKHFSTDLFSRLFRENEREMDSMFEERLKIVDNLLKYSIQYELILPGKIMTSNTDIQNGGALKWNVNLYRFLSDDYELTAESRKINLWALAVALLLVVFSVFCFIKNFDYPRYKRYCR
jgi:hypothetical protein